jgi:hypothetical protein
MMQLKSRLGTLTREAYDRAAEMNSLMVERFNVAGALVSKIWRRLFDLAKRFGSAGELLT